jgi:DNA-binding NarL/FixJ family response regulator
MPISILIAQSNFLVKEGLKSLVYNTKELSYEGEASSFEELIILADKSANAVIIIDHNDPAFGIASIRKIKAKYPGINFLSISDKPNRWMLSDALAAGITSYLLRDCGREEIIEAVQATAKGEQFFCGKILSDVLKTNDEVSAQPESESCEGMKISRRESEIIRLVAEGFTNKEIADKLFLSAHTVTTHRKNIMAKLGVNNTAGLMMYAIKNNIVSPNHFLFNTN